MSFDDSVKRFFFQNIKKTPQTLMALRPEGAENIPILLQEADLCFSNQNDLRDPKIGSKQSVTGPTL